MTLTESDWDKLIEILNTSDDVKYSEEDLLIIRNKWDVVKDESSIDDIIDLLIPLMTRKNDNVIDYIKNVVFGISKIEKAYVIIYLMAYLSLGGNENRFVEDFINIDQCIIL